MSKPIILISTQRSGTYYFLSVLQQFYGFESATVFGEIFRTQRDSLVELQDHFNESYDQVIERQSGSKIDFWKQIIQKSVDKNHLAVAAKIFYYHLDYEDPLWSYFSDEPHIIIHLIRKNIFNSYVSAKLAHQSGIWIHDYKKTEAYNYNRIKVDRDDALEYISIRMKDVEYIRNRYSKSDLQEIYYEDIGVSSQECSKHIKKIVDREPNNTIIRSRTKKQKILSNKDLITNYDEVADLDRYYF